MRILHSFTLILFFSFLFLQPISEGSTKIFFRRVPLQPIWNDRGSGIEQNIAFYRPSLPAPTPSPWHSLGDMAFPTYHSPYEEGLVFSTNQEGGFARPIGFRPMWDTQGTRLKAGGSLWEPLCPEDFVSLGYVANHGYHPPALDSVSCLHQSFVTALPWEKIHSKPLWNDRGSKAQQDVTVFQLREGRALPSGSFFSFTLFKSHPHYDLVPTLPGEHYQLNELFYELLEEVDPVFKEFSCNGSTLLCDRPYNEVAYLTTHNSMANSEDFFAFPNQTYTIKKQLEEGVRALMLDTHYFLKKTYLCHGSCLIGNRPLVEGFKEIAHFLETHPHEVVTIIFEDNISIEDTTLALMDSGLMPFAYIHDPAKGWPTLKEMIHSNQRLVLFTDEWKNPYPWTLHVWKYHSENSYNLKTKEDMNCEITRGNSMELITFNHFLTNVVGSAEAAKTVNTNPFLSERIEQCRQKWNKLPNFITIDFYHLGDLKSTLDRLNHSPWP